MEKNKKRGKEHLINLIGRRSNNTPNFALLIGAGASVSSGVKPTWRMIAEWQRQLYRESKSRKPFDEWLEEQNWHEDEEEYSILFEKVYDQRSQRRIYIEECVKDAKPSWGYIYLANIIANKYFNVIFTPNFDDLLNEACFFYADLRPLVCAHDSAVADIRVTSARPKIIKLHGDFLYDSIKNTVRETETLEKNMRDKFMQFAGEYGLVVVGYGGNDRSIMDILDMLLMSKSYFPNGLYWCIRNGDATSKKLERLMRRERAYWVEIQGYDQFMAELHKGLGLTLPDSVRDPYKATTEKLNRFIEARKEIKHEIIENDCKELEKQVKKIEQLISGKLPASEFDRLVPYTFLGKIEYENGNYETALSYYERALLQDPGDLYPMQTIVLTYWMMERFEEALQMSEEIVRQAPIDYLSYVLKGRTLVYLNRTKDAIKTYNKGLKFAREKNHRALLFECMSDAHLIAGEWKEALSDAKKSLRIEHRETTIINKSAALKKLNKEEEAKKILEDIMPRIEKAYDRAQAYAILGDKKNMLKELETAFSKNRGDVLDAKYYHQFFDIFRKDPDFLKLLDKYDRKKKKV